MAELAGLRYCDLAARVSLPPRPCPPSQVPRASALRYSSLQAGDSLGEEVLRMLLAERRMHGDFVSKISDMVWRRNGTNLDVSQATTDQENAAYVAQPENVRDDAMSEGVLRLAVTRDWVSGESSLPVSNRLSAKGAITYAFGVAFSCLYLQLLYRHTDNLSKKDVPEIFLKKKVSKIGIRSGDTKNAIEKMLGGTAVALSSPRLVIPAVIFGLSAVSDHFQNSILNFELVPGMMGFFADKAAALIQVYREEDLKLILPEEDADRS